MDEGMPWLVVACGLCEGRMGWSWKAAVLAAKNAAAAATTRVCLCIGLVWQYLYSRKTCQAPVEWVGVYIP